jgi:hypothetical protein
MGAFDCRPDALMLNFHGSGIDSVDSCYLGIGQGCRGSIRCKIVSLFFSFYLKVTRIYFIFVQKLQESASSLAKEKVLQLVVR